VGSVKACIENGIWRRAPGEAAPGSTGSGAGVPG
jgi:hypothetical protein